MKLIQIKRVFGAPLRNNINVKSYWIVRKDRNVGETYEYTPKKVYAQAL